MEKKMLCAALYGKNQVSRLCSITLLLSLVVFFFVSLTDLAIAQTPADSSTTGQPQEEEKDETGEFGAHGFNIVRVEQEDKITVPPDKADEVWAFLLHYLHEDQESLKKLDPNFTSYWSEELFIDTYYDTPSLQVYERRGGVRHRRRKNLTNPNDRKSGRELMQIKINDLSDNQLERGEVKYEIQYPEMINSPEDAHPMLGIVKPSHREDFKARLTKLGFDPYSMRPILTINDIRRRVYVRRNNEPFLSVSFDNASASTLWAKWHFYEIEPELNEIPFTEGDEATRAYMEKINTEIINTLMTKFPYLKRELTPKYCKAFNAFESQIPLYRLLIKAGMDKADHLVGVGALGVIAFAGCILLVIRKVTSKKQS